MLACAGIFFAHFADLTIKTTENAMSHKKSVLFDIFMPRNIIFLNDVFCAERE